MYKSFAFSFLTVFTVLSKHVIVGYGLRSITVKAEMSDQYSWSSALLSLVWGQATLTDCWPSYIDRDGDSQCHTEYKQ